MRRSRRGLDGTRPVPAHEVVRSHLNDHEATGRGASVPRTLKQPRAFLEGRTDPGDDGRGFARYLLDWLDGKRSEEALDKYWHRTFAGSAGTRMTG